MSNWKHKRTTLLVLALIMLFSLFSLTGCTQELSNADIGATYAKAIDNSVNEQFYFWQEYIYDSDNSKYNEVNVWSEKDTDSKPVLDVDGNLKDSYIRVHESVNSKPTAEYYWGKSKNAGSGDEKRETLFFTKYGEGASEKLKQDVTWEEFRNSELFRPYQLSVRLGEWKNLTVNDMDFNIEKSLKKKNVHVVKLQFKVSDSYMETYKQKNAGQPSIFEGSAYVAVEISYDRVAALTIYEKSDTGGGLAVDSEKYKLQTVYLGPRMQENNIPVRDATHTVDGVQAPLWKDHKIID